MCAKVKCVCLASLLLMACLIVMGCPEESGTRSGEVCPEGDLENIVNASDWAQNRAGIAKYRYTADVIGGFAEVELIDGAEESLGKLTVRQLFGADDVPDGVMEAVLNGANGGSTLRLVTQGDAIDRNGYTVKMRIEGSDSAPPLEMTARFKTVRCWLEDGSGVAPPCAAGLPLDKPSVTLPSCGLIVDERILEQQPPELQELTYSVASEDASGAPSVGGSRHIGEQTMHRLRVFDGTGVEEEEVIGQWLSETGADGLVGSEQERLLTTAFLDRSWWRVLEQHVAHCKVDGLPKTVAEEEAQRQAEAEEEAAEEAEAQATQTQVMSLCPGNQNNDDWGSGNDDSDANIWGDPHLTTFDGYAYDLQAAGEYILFKAQAGDPLVVQGRFEPLGDSGRPECGDLSWNTAIATEVAGKRITARVYPEWEIRIDGELVEGPDDIPVIDGGAAITLEDTDTMVIHWPGGEVVEFFRRPSTTPSLTINASLPPHRRGQIRGLLGQFDGDRSTDLVLPDGTILPQPGSFEDLYEVLAPSWRVRKSNSLFDYRDGEEPDTFLIDGFPESPFTIDDLPEDLAAEAEETCLAHDISDAHVMAACILDVACLNDDGYAQDAADAPIPKASQPPGRYDLMVDGDIRHTEAPEAVVAEEEVEPLDCRPRSTPRIAIFDEQMATSLEGDLEVNLTGAGTTTAESSLGTSTIGDGTVVSSYHLVRRPPLHSSRIYGGTVRFADPIIGVMVDPETVAEADAEIGAEQTTYQSTGFEGLRSDNDVLIIDDDGHTLHVTWSGAGAHRIRVITESSE